MGVKVCVLDICSLCWGLTVICGGCEYSFIGYLYFNISFSNVSGKNGNLSVSMLRFMF